MKQIKRIVLLLLTLFLLFFVTLVFLSYVYENKVKEYLIGEINKQLKTQVLVHGKDIHFSVLKNFPDASLEFDKVKMLESVSKKNKRADTLLTAGSIFLQFNVLQLFSGDYTIQKIKITDGKLKLKVYGDDSVNWDVWKEPEKNETEEDILFRLEKFYFENFRIFYSDVKNENDFLFLINEGFLSGEFTSSQYELSVRGNIFAEHFLVGEVNYLHEKKIKLDLSLNVDNEKGKYIFSGEAVQIAGLKIEVDGEYTDSDEKSDFDIRFRGKEMDIRSVLSLLPAKYASELSDYESNGEFYFNARIFTRDGETFYSSSFGIRDALIKQSSSKIMLNKVNLSGKYVVEPSGDYLDLESFTAQLEQGSVSGKMRINQLSSPFVSFSLFADLPLEDFRHLIRLDSIWEYPVESLSGKLTANVEYKGKIYSSGNYRSAYFEKMHLAGNIQIEKGFLKIKNSPLVFDSVNGNFTLNNNIVLINSFSAKTEKSNFRLQGSLDNILAFIMTEDADVSVNASFHSSQLDLNELLSDNRSTSSDTAYLVHFSPRIEFHLNSYINRLVFRKFNAQDIRGNFLLRNRKLIADPVSFSSTGGLITVTGMVDAQKTDTLLITCNAKLQRLNIRQLFYEFEDFGQKVISHVNLKGVGSADIQFVSLWKSDLSIDLNRIYVNSNLMIEKGELIHFEPMMALSDYISATELEHIRFSTLQNQIEIKNQTVFIPKMEIKSSALDIFLSGTHTFNNEIDYRVKLHLSDLLSKKVRKAKKENDEFGVVQDDKEGKMSLFLSMTGTVDNPVIQYDRQGAKQSLKENLAREKQTLKQILRDEFGWFKKDTALKVKGKTKEEPKDGKFIIRWDEEEEEKKQEQDDF